MDSDDEPSELAALIGRHVGRDEARTTAIPGLHLSRLCAPHAPLYGVYEPSLCVIAQGRKQVLLAEETYVYDSGRYLLVAADLPVVSRVVEASPHRPYLCLRLEIDPRQVGALLTDAALTPMPTKAASKRGLSVGHLDAPLLDAVTRLLRLLDRPQHIAVLAPLVLREILYLLLVGEHRERLCRMALAGGDSRGVLKTLHWLKDHFAEPMRIDALARQAHMSPTVFHHHFKAVTAMTPLQYQKRLRLQEARRLMLGEALDAATAGFRVGYESASQFSREYRRLFGEAPRRDTERLREASHLDGLDANAGRKGPSP